MKIELLTFEKTNYNGYFITLLHLTTYKINNSLLGLNFSKFFCYLNLGFISFKIFDKTD